MIPPEFVDLAVQMNDNAKSLTLSLIETLSKKTAAPGSFATVLSKLDVDTILKRAVEIEGQFTEKRVNMKKEAARSLLLPPGAMS